jgi:putative methylase
MPKPPVIRKKKQLEIFLEKVPQFTSPDPKLEQYKTPAPVAADILFNAYNEGDIAEKKIVDLGCGTGIFAVGSMILGASEVRALDIDPTALALAKEFSRSYELEIIFDEGDVKEYSGSCDTVIQNPPFGSQTRKADRAFLETASKLGNVIYSIHNSNTSEFISILVEKLGFDIAYKKKYIFKIKHTFDFHSKEHVDMDVDLYKLIRKQ